MIPRDSLPSPQNAQRALSRAWWVLAALATLGVLPAVVRPAVFVTPPRSPVQTRPPGIPPSAAPRARAQPAPPPGVLQFVVLSFDGAGSVDLWEHWRTVEARDHAHFTFCLSGVYMLTPFHATDYQGPRHRPGASDIGFLPTPREVDPSSYLRDLLGQISAGYGEGHEIASHFNGHFCAPRPASVGSWSAEEWSAELDQFSAFVSHVNENNLLDPPVTLPFGPSEVVGTRTPCLEGHLDALYPVLVKRGFRYDASQSSIEGRWPERKQGIWSFPLASVPLAGHRVHTLSMDYNLYVNQSHARDVAPDKAREIEAQAYATFMGYFERAYRGNRAPVSIGAHFTRWNDSAYLNALTRFVDDVCLRPEVRCVSYRELADWLDAQPPAPSPGAPPGGLSVQPSATPPGSPVPSPLPVRGRWRRPRVA